MLLPPLHMQAGAAAQQREVPGLRRVGPALRAARGAGGGRAGRLAAGHGARGERRAGRLAAEGAGAGPHRLRHDPGQRTCCYTVLALFKTWPII